MEFKLTKETVIISILSAIFGFFVNYWSTRIANNKLKAELLAELTALNYAKAQGRTGAIESINIEQRKKEIEAQLAILSK